MPSILNELEEGGLVATRIGWMEAENVGIALANCE